MVEPDDDEPGAAAPPAPSPSPLLSLQVWHAWQWDVPPCPQLYLYSRADALIPAAQVDLFMEQQAAHGAPVHHHCWDDSPHCEHYRVHREQYRSIVASFEQHACRYTAPPESWI